MRYCGSVDTISSYQRVKKHEDSPDRTQKVMRKSSQSSYNERPVGSMGRYLSESPDAPKLMGISSSRAYWKEKDGSTTQKKVGMVDLLIGYQALMQLSTTPTSVQKTERYPTTIGFVQHPVAQGSVASEHGSKHGNSSLSR